MEIAAKFRTNPEQFTLMLQCMESNGDIGRPEKGYKGRIRADKQWKQLSNLLNSVEYGVQRTPDKWKKVWADWKSKTKKKAAMIKKSRKGSHNNVRLTGLEKRILSVIHKSVIKDQKDTANHISDADDQQLEITDETATSLEVNESEVLNFDDYNSAYDIQSQGSSSESQPDEEMMTYQNEDVMIDEPTSSRRVNAKIKRDISKRLRKHYARMELNRLRAEENRERLMHKREMERLRLEAVRNESELECNKVIHKLADVIQNAMDLFKLHSQNEINEKCSYGKIIE